MSHCRGPGCKYIWLLPVFYYRKFRNGYCHEETNNWMCRIKYAYKSYVYVKEKTIKLESEC